MRQQTISRTLLKLLLLGTLSCIVVTSNNEDNANDVEQLEDIILNADDSQSLVEELAKLRGQWPFRDKSKCEKMNTLDRDYRQSKKKGNADSRVKRLLHRVPRCGIASQSDTDHRMPSSGRLRTVDEEGRVEKRERRESVISRTQNSEGDQRQRRFAADNVESIVDLPLQHSESHQTLVEDTGEKIKNHESRVVGGRLTKPGQWPWLAAVGRKVAGPKCGGSLIADRWVITAAHCFQDEEMPCHFNVRVGSRSWFYDVEGSHIDVTVEAIYRHPDYDQDTHANDIALLKLSSAVELDEASHINAICLPEKSRSVEPGTMCMAAGWGRTAENDKASVFEAREVEIPVLSFSDKCGEYLRGTIKKGMLCAGYLKGGKDTCQGDSGGPLIYERNGRWTLLGLTSFGEGCARANYPGIYTDVGYHLHWIASVMSRH